MREALFEGTWLRNTDLLKVLLVCVCLRRLLYFVQSNNKKRVLSEKLCRDGGHGALAAELELQ